MISNFIGFALSIVWIGLIIAGYALTVISWPAGITMFVLSFVMYLTWCDQSDNLWRKRYRRSVDFNLDRAERIIELEDELQEARKFKAFVHSFLDSHGVPVDPDPEGTLTHGCRISGRLVWLVGKIGTWGKSTTVKPMTHQELEQLARMIKVDENAV